MLTKKIKKYIFFAQIFIIIGEYLLFESLALFLGSPYYATSALNFKCDKQYESWWQMANDQQ